MPLLRGSTLTLSVDRPYRIVTDGTNLYAALHTGFATPGGLVKVNISSFTETSNVSFNSNEVNAQDVALLGGFAYTTHLINSLTNTNKGLVVKTNTTTMTRIGATNLFGGTNPPPDADPYMSSGSIYSDGSFLYVGSKACFCGAPYDTTHLTKMDGNFGSQTNTVLPNTQSTVRGTWQDDGTNLYVLGISQGDVSYPNDTIIKIDKSTFSSFSTLDLPTTPGFSFSTMLIGTKLYVGTAETPARVFRVDINSMKLDSTVITLDKGEGTVAWMMNNGNQIVIGTWGNSNFGNGTIFSYDATTYQRLSSIPSTTNSSGSPIITGVTDPTSQGTRHFWTTLDSPGTIIQSKNVYTGAAYTSPYSRQTSWFGGNAGVTTSVPDTRRLLTTGSNIRSGFGVSNQISSSNPVLQASMLGDPHFVGFEGESFFFNGIPGKFYNLFSDKNMQMNSLFRYWETSKENNYTVMEEIGVMFLDGTRIKIGATGYINIDGEDVYESIDERVVITDDLSEHLTAKEIEIFRHKEGFGEFIKGYVINMQPYRFIVTRSTDHVNPPYLNLITKLDGELTAMPHGIVGQTADMDGKPKEKLDGEDKDYEVSDLWGTDFTFNKFRTGSRIKGKNKSKIG